MITLQDIQAAVGSVLQQNGYSVIAAEVQEGFEGRRVLWRYCRLV